MESSVEGFRNAEKQDPQQAAVAEPPGVDNKSAEWTSDCLLTMRSPVRFTRADWP